MTNYNDGNWHGWNGGECPVHPGSVVDAVWKFNGGGNIQTLANRDAITVAWEGGLHGGIIAFRVVKEHREPVEVWFVNTCAGWFEGTQRTPGARLFREVIE